MPTIITQGQPLTEPTLPINILPEFLEEVRGLFDNIIYHWDQLLFKRKFRMSLQEAWNELRVRFDGLTGRMNLPDIKDKLREAGLAELQLELKLDVISDVWRRFHERGLVNLLQNLLEGISVCLDSLAKVFPEIEALKEFVEVVQWLISQNESLTGHEATT